LRTDADLAERNGNLEKAAQLRYGWIPALERELAAAAAENTAGRLVTEEVGAEEIPAVLASLMGVPADVALDSGTGPGDPRTAPQPPAE
jgi:ATP-dependent Clp protease ATP-binding subunit ClpB